MTLQGRLYLAAEVPEEPAARASHSGELCCGAGGKGLANTCPNILAAYCCSSVCSLACTPPRTEVFWASACMQVRHAQGGHVSHGTLHGYTTMLCMPVMT